MEILLILKTERHFSRPGTGHIVQHSSAFPSLASTRTDSGTGVTRLHTSHKWMPEHGWCLQEQHFVNVRKWNMKMKVQSFTGKPGISIIKDTQGTQSRALFAWMRHDNFGSQNSVISGVMQWTHLPRPGSSLCIRTPPETDNPTTHWALDSGSRSRTRCTGSGFWTI